MGTQGAEMAWPVVLMLTVTVGLGVILGLNYLRGTRVRWIGAVHLLLGLGALEQIAMLLNGMPNGVSLASDRFGNTAAVLIAGAFLFGLMAAVIGPRSKRNGELLLITHLSLGSAGFILLLAWVSKS